MKDSSSKGRSLRAHEGQPEWCILCMSLRYHATDSFFDSPDGLADHGADGSAELPRLTNGALGLAFFATFFTFRLAAAAVLVALVLSVRAVAPALRLRLFPLLTTFFAAVATFDVRFMVMCPPMKG